MTDRPPRNVACLVSIAQDIVDQMEASLDIDGNFAPDESLKADLDALRPRERVLIQWFVLGNSYLREKIATAHLQALVDAPDAATPALVKAYQAPMDRASATERRTRIAKLSRHIAPWLLGGLLLACMCAGGTCDFLTEQTRQAGESTSLYPSRHAPGEGVFSGGKFDPTWGHTAPQLAAYLREREGK